MSTRAMGALTFKPARGPIKRVLTSIELNSLVEQARLAVTGAMTDDTHLNAALRSIIDVGASAGGARAKAVIALHPETGEIRSGQRDAPDGLEHWLLKFDGMGVDLELGTTQNSGRVEFAYHLMARAAGTFAHNPNGESTHQHLMSVNGKFKGFGVGTAKRVIEKVRAAVLRWPEFAQQAAIPEAQMAEIQALLLHLR